MGFYLRINVFSDYPELYGPRMNELMRVLMWDILQVYADHILQIYFLTTQVFLLARHLPCFAEYVHLAFAHAQIEIENVVERSNDREREFLWSSRIDTFRNVTLQVTDMTRFNQFDVKIGIKNCDKFEKKKFWKKICHGFKISTTFISVLATSTSSGTFVFYEKKEKKSMTLRPIKISLGGCVLNIV